MYYEDFDDYDYERADYEATLYQDGIGICNYHESTYPLIDTTPDKSYPDYADPGCPTCKRADEMRERVMAGELDPSAVCWACEADPSDTSFMGQSVCQACYQTLSSGRAMPDRLRFANPGGNSALRAAGPGNPRIHPCPTCWEPNRLTPQDKARGYQCDTCADRAEGTYRGGDY